MSVSTRPYFEINTDSNGNKYLSILYGDGTTSAAVSMQDFYRDGRIVTYSQTGTENLTLQHNGIDGYISTNTGNIILAPAGTSATIDGYVRSTGDIQATVNVTYGLSQGGLWGDITSDIIAKSTGVENPTFSVIASGPQSAYKFSVNDKVWVNYHLPHSYSPNTAIYFHVHWLSDGTNTNSVVWQWTYSVAKGHGQEAFTDIATGTVVNKTQIVDGTQYKHYITEITTPIESSHFEPDSIILVQISRITNGGTDNTDNIFAFTADCHFQHDRVGTRNRNPDFNASR